MIVHPRGTLSTQVFCDFRLHLSHFHGGGVPLVWIMEYAYCQLCHGPVETPPTPPLPPSA